MVASVENLVMPLAADGISVDVLFVVRCFSRTTPARA